MEGVCAKQKKVTEHILRNLPIGVKIPFSSHFCPLWDPNQKTKQNRFLYSPITHLYMNNICEFERNPPGPF